MTDITELPFEAFLKREMSSADASHDIEHVRRVVRNAGILLESTPEADRRIVTAAAWLHDCVTLSKNHPNRKKASVMAAEKASEFLKKNGIPEDQIRAVHHAIEAHSFSAGIEPETIEAEIVQDADRIDALGAIGLARCFMTGASMGSALYNPNEPIPKNRTADDKNYCVDHFFTKLLKLPETMRTEAGKKEANRRADVIRYWLEEFRRETGLG